jgi:hypothetical protein
MHMDVSLWEAKNQIGPFEANKVTKVTKLCQESSNDTYKLSFWKGRNSTKDSKNWNQLASSDIL